MVSQVSPLCCILCPVDQCSLKSSLPCRVEWEEQHIYEELDDHISTLELGVRKTHGREYVRPPDLPVKRTNRKTAASLVAKSPLVVKPRPPLQVPTIPAYLDTNLPIMDTTDELTQVKMADLHLPVSKIQTMDPQVDAREKDSIHGSTRRTAASSAAAKSSPVAKPRRQPPRNAYSETKDLHLPIMETTDKLARMRDLYMPVSQTMDPQVDASIPGTKYKRTPPSLTPTPQKRPSTTTRDTDRGKEVEKLPAKVSNVLKLPPRTSFRRAEMPRHLPRAGTAAHHIKQSTESSRAREDTTPDEPLPMPPRLYLLDPDFASEIDQLEGARRISNLKKNHYHSHADKFGKSESDGLKRDVEASPYISSSNSADTHTPSSQCDTAGSQHYQPLKPYSRLSESQYYVTVGPVGGGKPARVPPYHLKHLIKQEPLHTPTVVEARDPGP